MNITTFKNRLKTSGLKLTLPRKKILEYLLGKTEAVTYNELLQLAEQDKDMDRVTIYRTLKSFEEIGLLHRVFSGEGVQHFALVKDVEPAETSKQHLHFCCIACKSVFTLDDYAIPKIELPSQYNVISLDMTITGICKKCTGK